jgi:SAM-dependent methyltransferase
VLDFGCGPGVMIDRMNQAGFLYIGCDYSADAAKLYHENYGQYPDLYVNSLSNPLCQQSIDVFLSFDVFEHLTDLQIEGVLEQVSSIPTLFLNISRSRGIPGHINIKSDSAWISFIQGLGYSFDSFETERVRRLYIFLKPDASDGWNENLFIFHKFRDDLGHSDIC